VLEEKRGGAIIKMAKIEQLKSLAARFTENLHHYKDSKQAYNEHSCRIEYIDPLLKAFGWDVANNKGLSPQYREVIAENHGAKTDRPDYSLTLRGVTKLFVEAKKPSVDITSVTEPAFQARKYGWNANHKVVILTNFEYLIIYDTTVVPNEYDNCFVALYKKYHCSEYCDKFDEIYCLISRDSVYSGAFDSYFESKLFVENGAHKQQVDAHFLAEINRWRVALSNDLYMKDAGYRSLEVLNDVVQDFINRIVFLRICEDRNLPLYHKLKETIADQMLLREKISELFRVADKRYNSGLFVGDSIVFDLSNAVIADMIEGLYYPKSPYLFSIIKPNLLGKVYELFLTEQLILLPDGSISLSPKKECANRSIVTTPDEIVKYMTNKTLGRLCDGKTPNEICQIRIADIACGSGVFLEAAFEYLQNHCVEWYMQNKPDQLIEIGNGLFKLPLEEKKKLLCSCVYGIDIDVHAVEVAKFSLLVKLIENETSPSVVDSTPILPMLDNNILHGNSLVEDSHLLGVEISDTDHVSIVPFNWNCINFGENFDIIIGNPPYVSTEGLHALVPAVEFKSYKKNYMTAYKQFDKYFLFIERSVKKVKDGGCVCYIVPNKFFKIGAGKNLCKFIASQKMLVSIDDFGDAQLFDDKTIYSSIVLLERHKQKNFTYSRVASPAALLAGESHSCVKLNSDMLEAFPWKLTDDLEVLALLDNISPHSVLLETHVEIFNGIQTSAERPIPIYWFSDSEVICENNHSFTIQRDNKSFLIEKAILKPYFKPTKKTEKGLNSYSSLSTNKHIIFPYDNDGKLINKEKFKENYPGAYAYLTHYYNRLVPKSVSPIATRDVPNATAETWYQYGRTQALTAFIKTPKLIVGVLSKDPMYVYDENDMLIASGGTAGYCAISKKQGSPYALEYIQAWLSNPITERIIRIFGSDFEGGFVARGTFLLPKLPFVELDFNSAKQKTIYEKVIETTRKIYILNNKLALNPSKTEERSLLQRKCNMIDEVESLVTKVYHLDF
jgi:type I restriction-modification system DNA methylase subunit